MTDVLPAPSSYATVELQISIDRTVETVWRALTQEINHWWLDDYRAVSDSWVALELRPGGRLYEENSAGSGLLWYTVIEVSPPSSLHLWGALAPPFGGPLTSMLWLQLTQQQGEPTRLRVSDSLVGNVSAKTVNTVEQGWRRLFEAGLKAYLENSA